MGYRKGFTEMPAAPTGVWQPAKCQVNGVFQNGPYSSSQRKFQDQSNCSFSIKAKVEAGLRTMSGWA